MKSKLEENVTKSTPFWVQQHFPLAPKQKGFDTRPLYKCTTACQQIDTFLPPLVLNNNKQKLEFFHTHITPEEVILAASRQRNNRL